MKSKWYYDRSLHQVYRVNGTVTVFLKDNTYYKSALRQGEIPFSDMQKEITYHDFIMWLYWDVAIV